MTDAMPSPHEEPFDLDVIHADDAMLDALGRGEPAGTDDGIGAMLSAWRAELATAQLATEELAAAVSATEGAQPSTVDDARPSGAAPAPVSTQEPAARPRRRFAPASRRARIAVAATLVAAIAGGTAAAAVTASPGSLLWPVSRVINPARADRVAAEDALAQARTAVADRQFDQARRLLSRAATLIAQVHDPRQATRLRAELDQIRQLLANATALGVPLPASTPGGAPLPSPTPTPGTAAKPSPKPGATAGKHGPGLPSLLPIPIHPSSPRPSTGGPLPTILPTGVLPTLPIPLPGG